MEAPALGIDVQGFTGVFTISELYYYSLEAVLAPLYWLQNSINTHINNSGADVMVQGLDLLVKTEI